MGLLTAVLDASVEAYERKDCVRGTECSELDASLCRLTGVSLFVQFEDLVVCNILRVPKARFEGFESLKRSQDGQKKISDSDCAFFTYTRACRANGFRGGIRKG